MLSNLTILDTFADEMKALSWQQFVPLLPFLVSPSPTFFLRLTSICSSHSSCSYPYDNCENNAGEGQVVLADYHSHTLATSTIAGKLNYQQYNNMAIQRGLEVTMAETNTGESTKIARTRGRGRRDSKLKRFRFSFELPSFVLWIRWSFGCLHFCSLVSPSHPRSDSFTSRGKLIKPLLDSFFAFVSGLSIGELCFWSFPFSLSLFFLSLFSKLNTFFSLLQVPHPRFHQLHLRLPSRRRKERLLQRSSSLPSSLDERKEIVHR